MGERTTNLWAACTILRHGVEKFVRRPVILGSPDADARICAKVIRVCILHCACFMQNTFASIYEYVCVYAYTSPSLSHLKLGTSSNRAYK